MIIYWTSKSSKPPRGTGPVNQLCSPSYYAKLLPVSRFFYLWSNIWALPKIKPGNLNNADTNLYFSFVNNVFFNKNKSHQKFVSPEKK